MLSPYDYETAGDFDDHEKVAINRLIREWAEMGYREIEKSLTNHLAFSVYLEKNHRV
jgi:hypothetical protein